MSQRYFTWQVPSFLGAWLFFVGLFFIPSEVVHGLRVDVLAAPSSARLPTNAALDRCSTAKFRVGGCVVRRSPHRKPER
ncbi:hypothetical protein LOC51_10190 [Rubrivivax sp. JA1024]|nr:hypothetical protein [Rubrivivax sp. JA1024]